MATSEAVALPIFASYFLIIIALFSVILKSFHLHERSFTEPSTRNALLFSLFAIGSFAHTWFYMFKFMEWSFTEYEGTAGITSGGFLRRISAWLVDTALFEQAWFTVCSGPMNWWWSEQLCTYTVGTWTILLFVEGQRFRIKHVWAYMLLGQFVAISVASNLFYVAISLSRYGPDASRQQERSTHPVLWLAVLASLATVARSPYTNEQTFLPNLLLMHGFLTVPLVFISLPSSSALLGKKTFSMNSKVLHCLVFASASLIRASSTLVALKSVGSTNLIQFLETAWRTLHSHPAQSSIGWDVVWTSLSFVVWLCMTSKTLSTLQRLAVAVFTTLASAGVVSPFVEMMVSLESSERGPLDVRKTD